MSKEYYYFICFSLHLKEKNISENNEENEIDPRKKYKFLLRNYLQIFKNIILWGKIKLLMNHYYILLEGIK